MLNAEVLAHTVQRVPVVVDASSEDGVGTAG